MKVAVIGSRSIFAADIGMYISDGDEIVSGGAVGIDSCAAEYAKKNGLKGLYSKGQFWKVNGIGYLPTGKDGKF